MVHLDTPNWALDSPIDTYTDNRRENSEPIPTHLIIEILSRLPGKSIARCCCVPKLWVSVLRLPYFTELFLTRSLARPQLLFACQNNGEVFFFSSPQPQNPDDENSSPVAANRLTHFPVDGSFDISGAVHGLVGLSLRNKQISKGIRMICNPSTGQVLPLPKVKSSKVGARIFRVHNFLGYDPVDKQFKVLSMIWSLHKSRVLVDHQVLTLGTRKLSWRMIKCCIPHYSKSNKGICINGVLYYRSTNRLTRSFIIVSFDVRSEKFSFIENKAYGTLINYNGKLGSLVYGWSSCGYGGSIELRVLVDFEKQEWSKHIYELPPLWKNVVGEAKLDFVGFIGTNEIVLSGPFHVIYYNVEKRSIVKVRIQGMEAFHHNSHSTSLDHVEDVKLMEDFAT